MKTLRVISMNVRYSRGKDGKNIWTNRKNLVGKILHKYTPDIIGFQEPLHNIYFSSTIN